MPELPAELAPPTSPPERSGVEPTRSEPPVGEPLASEPSTSEPLTSQPSTSQPSTSEPSVGKPLVGGPAIGDPSATVPPVEKREPVRLGRTRTSAIWFGVWAGVVGVILLIIFVAQNTASVEINFLWLSGSISLALALLIAGVAGAAIAMGVAAARIIQLRRLFRRSR
jgi:uncharacterized integral membrane protein